MAVHHVAANISQGRMDLSSAKMTKAQEILRNLSKGSSKVAGGDEGYGVNTNTLSSDLFNGIQPADVSDGEIPSSKGRPRFNRLKATFEPKRSRSTERTKAPEQQSGAYHRARWQNLPPQQFNLPKLEPRST